MSPKVSMKSHPLRMSTRSRQFSKIVSTRCHCPRNVSIPTICRNTVVAKIFPLCKLEASRPIFVRLQSEPQPSKNPMSHLRKNPSNNLKPNTAGNASNTNACSGNQFMTSAKSIKASRNCQVQ